MLAVEYRASLLINPRPQDSTHQPKSQTNNNNLKKATLVGLQDIIDKQKSSPNPTRGPSGNGPLFEMLVENLH